MPYRIDKAQFFVHKDSVNAFYGSLTDASSDPSRVLPHSDLFYVRAALEAKFPGRLFTMQEIKELILEIYGVDY